MDFISDYFFCKFCKRLVWSKKKVTWYSIIVVVLTISIEISEDLSIFSFSADYSSQRLHQGWFFIIKAQLAQQHNSTVGTVE